MLPADSKARKALPLARGVLDYFPDAIAAVADLSQKGNDKHNPGEPLHWSRDKSSDHADCIMRHLVERGTIDPEDGILHDVKVAWRALAMAQLALEKQREKAPVPEFLKQETWLHWSGHDCPVASYQLVEVRLRDGTRRTALAGSLRWNYESGDAFRDVVNWRLV